jgi:hypothetical protein
MTREALQRILRPVLLALAGLWIAGFASATAPADALRAKHASLATQLANNPFQRPLHLESAQTSGDLKGEVYAIVDHPFATVDAALKGADVWCDILILHLNVKHCQASGGSTATTLAVSIGRKHDQPLNDAYRVNFAYQLASSTPDYLEIHLSAKDGPMGTSNYHIVVEATQLDARRSFMHMSYSYSYGFAARMAMQGYLGTVGSGKVGFSVVGKKPDGQPVYVDNVRGVVERNTMRYYLAIDTYLASLSAPASERQERRLREWFAATERYALQLHEVDRDDYLAMKRKEIARQGKAG